MSNQIARRRSAVGVAGMGLLVAALGVACVPETPGGGTTATTEATTTTTEATTTTAAPSTDIDVTNATLSWSVNRYAQTGIFGPWSFTPQGAGVTVTQQLGTTVSPLETNATKQYNVINWAGGTGTLDSVTGAGTITWNTADVVVNAYPPQFNAPNETFGDPVLTIDADGSGELSVLFSAPAHEDMNGDPVPAVSEVRTVILEFDDLAQFTSGNIRIDPNYIGEQYLVDGVNAVASCTPPVTSGAFPQAFIDVLPFSIRAHYYNTGCGGMQDLKAPTPLYISLG